MYSWCATFSAARSVDAQKANDKCEILISDAEAEAQR